MDLTLVSEWCPRERIALLHDKTLDDKTLEDIFYLVLCLGMFLWAAALFSYNTFLLIFFLLIFLLFCFIGSELSIFYLPVVKQ